MHGRILRLVLVVCAWLACVGSLGAESTLPEPILLDGAWVHPTRVLALRARPAGDKRIVIEAVRSGPVNRLLPDLEVLEDTVAASQAGTQAERDGRAAERLRSRIEALRATGRYAAVQPDYAVSVALSPSDARYADGTLWGLNNTGANQGNAGVDIGAAAAWDVTTGNPDMIVAVIDSGINTTHTELQNRLWTNPGESGGGRETNRRDDDGDGYVDNVHGINAITLFGDPEDDSGHGTHVAGIIGAAANGGGPQVGVTWQGRLMALKSFDRFGRGYYSDSIRCVEFAVARGAKIINASWGGSRFDPLLFEAMQRAAAAGVLIVAAAGNDNVDMERSGRFFPACYPVPGLLAVGAHDRLGARAYFSNYGASIVDLFAPGVTISSTTIGGRTAYASGNGTSFAAPFVSGAAALLFSRYPELSIRDARAWLIHTSTRSTLLDGRAIGGRLNAAVALAPYTGVPLAVLRPAEGLVFRPGGSTAVEASLLNPRRVRGAVLSVVRTDGWSVSLRDDGKEPDKTADDGLYTGNLELPELAGSTQFQVRLVGTVPGHPAVDKSFTFPLTDSPPNDIFGNALVLSGETAGASGTLEGATAEANEPNHAGAPAINSVWLEWTAPLTGSVVIRTGGDVGTRLAVYTGSTLAALQPVAADQGSGPGDASIVQFAVSQGTTYRIAVDSLQGVAGDATLTLVATRASAPDNDRFDRAATLPSGNGPVSGNNDGADVSRFEQDLIEDIVNRTTWWNWTPEAGGVHRLSLSNLSFRGGLAVFRGQSAETLSLAALAVADFAGGTAELELSVQAGETLHVMVFSADLGSGPYVLSVRMVATGLLNDHFSERTDVPAAGGLLVGTTNTAGRDAGEPRHAPGDGDASIWWKWTSPSDGNVVLQWGSAPTSSASVVAVYTGSDLALLTPVVTYGTNRAPMTFPVRSGVEYQIAVCQATPLTPPGTVYLEWNFSPSAGGVVNDAFARPFLLPALAGDWTADVDLNASTVEAGETTHGELPVDGSLWYLWRPRKDSLLTFRPVVGEPVIVAAYLGDSLDALEPVPVGGSSVITGGTGVFEIFGRAGVTYRVSINRFAGMGGTSRQSISVSDAEAATWDQFATRPLLSDSTTAWLGAATRETGEPEHAGLLSRHTGWWRWIGDGRAMVIAADAVNASMRPVLAVYTGNSFAKLQLVGASVATSVSAEVQFFSEVGVEYQIAVTNYGSRVGTVALRPMGSWLVPADQQAQAPFSLRFSVPPLVVGQSADIDAELTPTLVPVGIVWQTAASPEGPWTDLTEGEQWQGTRSSRLHLSAATAALDGVWLRANAPGDSSHSRARKFRVFPASGTPSLSLLPESQTQPEGGSATLTAAVDGVSSPSVFWQRRTQGRVEWEEVQSGGRFAVSEATLNIHDFSVTDVGEYRFVVPRELGEPLYSRSAQLAVAGAPAPLSVALDFSSAPRPWSASFLIPARVTGFPRAVRYWQCQPAGTTGWRLVVSDFALRVTENGDLSVGVFGTWANGMRFRLVVVQPGGAFAISEPVVLNVPPEPVAMTWDQPAPITFGQRWYDVIQHPVVRTPVGVGQISYNADTGDTLIPGRRQLRATFSDSTGRYETTVRTVEIEVRKALMEVSVGTLTRSYGAANPTPRLTYRSSAGTPGQYPLEAYPTAVVQAGADSPPGTYPIVVSGGSSPYFDIVTHNGSLVILPNSGAELVSHLQFQIDQTSPSAPVTRENVVTVYGGGGLQEGAMQFDGVTSRFSLADAARLDLQEHSLALWVRPDSVGDGIRDASGRVVLLRKGSAPNYALQWDPSTGLAEATVSVAGQAQPVRLSSSKALPRGRATHLACSYEASNGGTLRLYWNGILDTVRTGVGTPVSNNEPLVLGGGEFNGAACRFAGAIGDARVYRGALSLQEIEVLAKQGAGAEGGEYFPGETTLFGSWRRSALGTYFRGVDFPWIYHVEHGWLYCSQSAVSTGLTFYDPVLVDGRPLGWLHTTPETYPWLWRYGSTASEGGWLYYRKGGDPLERHFYDQKAGVWLSVGPK